MSGSSSKDIENLQYLGVGLIVLSIILLWCWAKKRGQTDGLKGITSQPYHGDFRSTDGMTDAHHKLAHDIGGGGLEFKKDGKKVESMHDLENVLVNRHRTAANVVRSPDVTSMRWKTDAGVGIDAFEARRGSANDAYRQSLIMGGDVITPLPHAAVAHKTSTLSGDILQLTDYTPQYARVHYAPARGTVST